MSDTSVVGRFLDGFGTGDVATALAVLHDDVHVSEPDGLPTGGEYHGKPAFLAFLGKVAETYTVEIHDRELFDAGDLTLALIATTWTSRTTGAEIRTRFCELYTVVDGLITAIDVYPKDTRALYELTLGGD